MEPPGCCNQIAHGELIMNYMELKQVIKFNINDTENGDKFYFQCNNCGEVIKKCDSI